LKGLLEFIAALLRGENHLAARCHVTSLLVYGCYVQIPAQYLLVNAPKGGKHLLVVLHTTTLRFRLVLNGANFAQLERPFHNVAGHVSSTVGSLFVGAVVAIFVVAEVLRLIVGKLEPCCRGLVFIFYTIFYHTGALLLIYQNAAAQLAQSKPSALSALLFFVIANQRLILRCYAVSH